jgi:hypothetical protein
MSGSIRGGALVDLAMIKGGDCTPPQIRVAKIIAIADVYNQR